MEAYVEQNFNFLYLFPLILFQLFLLITWTAELYMFPLALLLIFGKNYLFVQMTGSAGEDEVREKQIYIDLYVFSLY